MHTKEPRENKQQLKKKGIIVGIALFVALLHFITGTHYTGPFPIFVNGYLIDILLPFSLYLLLTLINTALFQNWDVKAGLIFITGLIVELSQYAGIPFLGSTFDPWDIFMYAFGVGLAVICDLFLFPRLFLFWQTENQTT